MNPFLQRIRYAGWLLFLGLLATPGAWAQVVISQVYGGGGNAGATLRNDFIELFNRGNSPVNLSGTSVQYASATGTSWAVTALTGSIPAGGYYLIQQAAGTGGTTDLPTPNATGTIAMSATAGKVALVNTTTALTIACPSGSGILDFVGYGSTANCFETSPAPAPSNTTAVLRQANGCTDDNNNSTDFAASPPSPRNSSTALSTCGVASLSLSIDNVSLNEGNTGTTAATFTVSLTAPAPAGGVTFDITTQNSTATTADNDYMAKSLTGQTIPAGSRTYSFPVTVNGDARFEPDETFLVNVINVVGATIADGQGQGTIVNDDAAPVVRIHDIQGTAHLSHLNGQAVSTVPGIVTGVRSNGFYLQDPTSDTDDRTSEGIFVFTSSAPTVQVGHAVTVSGTVAEFRPGGNGGGNNLTTTQIQSPAITTLSTGNGLPTPTLLGNGGRTIPNTIIEDQTGNVETGGLTFDPATDGIDFYESLEGMLVQINSPLAVSPTATSGGAAGEIWVVADNGANATIRSVRGGVIVRAADFNPERIQLDDALLNPAVGGYSMPTVNVGAQLVTLVGIVNWAAENYEVLVTATPTVIFNNLEKETTSLTPTPDQLTVSTYNVENLSPGDNSIKYANLADRIINNLRLPDILLLEEIQDNNGATNDAVVDASATFNALINAITTLGGPTYQFRQINPVDDQDGGQPGGNIRVGFLFNPARVSFVDRAGGTSTATTTVNTVGGVPQLSFSPGRVDPANPAFANNDGSGPASASRKPLAGEFIFNGQTVFVIGVHFSSKIPDQALFGVNQPSTLLSEPQRRDQATVVKNFVQRILSVDANANVIVLGDVNDFEFSQPVSILENAPLNTLIKTLPPNERYTYNFEGNSQAIDHILVSGGLFGKLNGYDVVHVNAEFVDQDSDHDPSVARFDLPCVLTASSLCGSNGRSIRSDANTRLSAKSSAEIPSDWQISVSPNPTDGLLRIGIRGAADQSLNVELFNATGQSIRQVGLEKAQNEERLSWDISRQPPGLYQLRVNSGQQIKTLKIVR